MNITKINNIIQDNVVYIDSDSDSDSDSMVDLSLDDLYNSIFDLSSSLNKRKKAIDMYYKNSPKDSPNNLIEIINKLSGMYTFSGTKLLEEYINDLCLNSDLPIEYKAILVEALTTEIYLNRDEPPKISKYGYDTLNILCNNLNGLSTTLKIYLIKILMKSNKYESECIKYFSIIINDLNLDVDFRYKTILSLEYDIANSLISKNYIKQFLYIFFYNIIDNTNISDNIYQLNIRYKILSAQYILQKKYYDNINNFTDICNNIINIYTNQHLDYNIRADACDVILRIESTIDDVYKDIYKTFLKDARNMINILGTNNDKTRTIYDNAQNIHVIELEDSIIQGIEFLNNINYSNINYPEGGQSPNLKYIKEKIDEIINKNYDKEKDKDFIQNINSALNRIIIDRALYSKYNSTLSSILIKLWIFIESKNFDESEQLKLRLIQELNDMANTCSTGYAGRLLNVLSGFSDFNFMISWEDQIIANFTGRMNAKIREINVEWNNTRRLGLIVENILLNNFNLKFNLIYNRNIRDYKQSSKIDKFINEFKFLIDKDYNQYKNLFLRFLKDNNLYPTNDELIELYKSSNDINEILLNFQDEVLNQMDINVKNRSSFLLFAREIFLSITEELYNEFKDYISDSDYNLYIRKAIINYEGHY